MNLLFKKNVLVYGQHREKGSVHEIKDSDAVMLIADHCAVRAPSVPQIAAPVVETAESKVMQSAESAVVKTAKGKARK